MIYQALETTLRNVLLERWEQVPALRMIRQSAGAIRERAERLLIALSRRARPDGGIAPGNR